MMTELDGSEYETARRRSGLRRNQIPIPDRLIQERLAPFRYVSNLTEVILNMYRRSYNDLHFDPQEIRKINPRTRNVERFYSHPCTAKWWHDAYEYAKSLHPGGTRIRILCIVLYGDATTAGSKTHHPVYMSIANHDLKSFLSMHGKETVALIPNLNAPAEIPANTIARYRTAIFQNCVGQLVSPFETVHSKVSSLDAW
jgi:hypothetical protein